MNILVTAGNTQVPIDRVRCITNIFSGRTGASIAAEFRNSGGHNVTLLTSLPEAICEFGIELEALPKDFRVVRYRTFDELKDWLARELMVGAYDALIHTAAVSDYLADGVYSPAEGTSFSQLEKIWIGVPPAMLDVAKAKIKSDEPELWLRLKRAPKLVDMVRTDWGFGGVLVKFKLEGEIREGQLLEIAERSRLHSNADLMVANSLESLGVWAYVGPLQGGYERMSRANLPARLLDAVQQKHKERKDG